VISHENPGQNQNIVKANAKKYAVKLGTSKENGDFYFLS
jgi:hypothetical protein